VQSKTTIQGAAEDKLLIFQNESSIVNQKHFQRCKVNLEDKGALSISVWVGTHMHADMYMCEHAHKHTHTHTHTEES
jgi:hypothetical protein